MFTVEAVNALVMDGVPFRDAYKKIGEQVENETFTPPLNLQHTHEGSIGNLCLPEIETKMQNILAGFAFNKVQKAVQKLKKL